jgi:galactokinase
MGLFTGGADLLIDSDIPFGAGLSSSAALEVSLGLALASAAGVEIDRHELAFAGQRVEHEYAGVRSGIMDQFASALAIKDHALLIDCRSNDVEHVPLELGDTLLMICDTRVKHSLASSEYNKRREECEEGVQLLAERIRGVASLRDISTDDLEKYESELPDIIGKRCRHVVTENERTTAAVDALRRDDLSEVGRLMYLSHDSLRDDYEVSAQELDLLVDTASQTDGVYGSRMTGGGFGGCTISMIRGDIYEEFSGRLTDAYASKFGRDPEIAIVKPSDGAREESF